MEHLEHPACSRDVGYSNGASTLTISLSQAATTFGFELEPDLYQTDEVTASYFSGSTLVGTIDLFPNGNSGALLYAASTTTNPFTSVVINDVSGDDFAIARQRYSTSSVTPEPGTFALMGSALLGAFGLFRKSRKN